MAVAIPANRDSALRSLFYRSASRQRGAIFEIRNSTATGRIDLAGKQALRYKARLRGLSVDRIYYLRGSSGDAQAPAFAIGSRFRRSFFPFSSALAVTVNLDAPTMKAALRTVTPEEGCFVEKVVRLMDKGKLPRPLVETTFDWARRKNEHRFQYFKQALTVQAKKLGLSSDELPEKEKVSLAVDVPMVCQRLADLRS